MASHHTVVGTSLADYHTADGSSSEGLVAMAYYTDEVHCNRHRVRLRGADENGLTHMRMMMLRVGDEMMGHYEAGRMGFHHRCGQSHHHVPNGHVLEAAACHVTLFGCRVACVRWSESCAVNRRMHVKGPGRM